VNLKILLQPAIVRGALSESRRNRLLAAAGDDVAAGVLRDNRDQALSLTLEQSRSRSDPGAYRDQLIAIAQRRAIHRAAPPPAADERHDQGTHSPGLTRPELAELTALTKIDLVATVEQSPLIDDPYLVERFLRSYFPPSLASAHAADVPHHGLRRELVATRVVNELVDLMGSVFISNLHRDQGIDSATAVRAWLVASGVLDLTARAEALRQSAIDLSAEAEIGAFLALEQPTRRACMWAATILDPGIELGATIAHYKPGFDRLVREFDGTLTGGERDHFEHSYRDLRAAVHQEELALQLSRLAFVGHLLTILNLSFARGAEPLTIARAYFGMSDQFEFAMLEGAIDQLSTTDRWESAAARDLRTELAWARNQLCVAILEQPANDSRADVAATLRERRRTEVAQLMNDLRILRTIGLPPLQVTVRALSRLASGA
jgi:glutamate dehydrogenase